MGSDSLSLTTSVAAAKTGGLRYNIAMLTHPEFPPKTCTVCGKTWQPMTRYQAKRNLTCGKKCAAARVSQARQGTGKPPEERAGLREIACAVCGAKVWKYRSRLKRIKGPPTCSLSCRGKLRAKELVKHSHKGRAAWTAKSLKSYRQKMSGPNNPAWKGGVTYRKGKGNYKGPRYVRCPQEFLPMARKDGYVMEHRLVMAKMLGRCLTRTEVVHHRDHNPRNNDPANLELFASNAEHKRAEGRRARPAAD